MIYADGYTIIIHSEYAEPIATININTLSNMSIYKLETRNSTLLP